MNFKAIVYDTQDGKPMLTTVRGVFCDKNGKPDRVQAHNGLNYNEFHIWDDSQPSKWSDHEFHDELESGLSKGAIEALVWLNGETASKLTVKQAREIIEMTFGKEVSQELKTHLG